MAKYKAYPEYKDSGVEWLGEIPIHWIRSKFGYLKTILTDYTANGSFADLKSNVTYLDEPSYARLVRLTDLRNDLNNSNGVWIDKNSYNYLGKSSLYGGEFLLANVGAYAGLFYQMPYNKGPASLAPNMFMAKFSPEKISREFIAYVGQADNISKQLMLKATASSAQPKLNKDDFKSIFCCYPPLNEQTKISVFLDHETAKIDNLIEKQQQLIELLKEKRQAVISHAVTKGLNPDVPMKDSGVEWLGEVPKHWKCGYLRWYISVSSGTYLNNKEFETDESNDCMNPVIGGNGVMGFTSKTNDGNCLVVGRVGALCGNVHQIRRSCWVTDNALKITYGCDFDVDYLEMYLKVLDLNKLANHNAQPLITGTMIKEQVAIIPPIDEQKNITKFIQSKVGKIDILILKSSEAVDKIKERRTALISAAVTGKIDVRDWVAPDTQDIEASQEATA
ncbi:restriction endonuclease subunit S [Cronobacter muytjensii]|uniref:Restriction endonuclease subunit S n=1 Tax=Cronobacter muytjensii TaxID=413501 RepID=A0A2T7AU61_9ENTR|nr:restriction endonuclease subunit S [Cronobacter muytjensii]KAB0875608.1 restriction endonuclease subunit S [Cronobacter muytjensii]MBF4810623.1 restriction endonuclease subunit S [Cronobacter muytjensii]PUX15228.1 restriction endonuclease subunit S [Cronobacter muytjensii]